MVLLFLLSPESPVYPEYPEYPEYPDEDEEYPDPDGPVYPFDEEAKDFEGTLYPLKDGPVYPVYDVNTEEFTKYEDRDAGPHDSSTTLFPVFGINLYILIPILYYIKKSLYLKI
jgi:hypothetical protein